MERTLSRSTSSAARAMLPGFSQRFASRRTATDLLRWQRRRLIAERYFPEFAQTHPMPLVPPAAEPRLWIGNAAKVATHNDPIENVAVVAAGRRRFTLFPPSAEPDLYMGPHDPTPGGRTDQHGACDGAGPRSISALRFSARGRASGRALAGRCDLHSAGLVPSRRGARALQRPRELLVGRGQDGARCSKGSVS